MVGGTSRWSSAEADAMARNPASGGAQLVGEGEAAGRQALGVMKEQELSHERRSGPARA
jgi:hypothetical protein